MALHLFQSTRPVKDATLWHSSHSGMTLVSIHASREGRDRGAFIERGRSGVSIHASREGRDSIDSNTHFILTFVSIHASREGRDVNFVSRVTGDL